MNTKCAINSINVRWKWQQLDREYDERMSNEHAFNLIVVFPCNFCQHKKWIFSKNLKIQLNQSEWRRVLSRILSYGCCCRMSDQHTNTKNDAHKLCCVEGHEYGTHSKRTNAPTNTNTNTNIFANKICFHHVRWCVHCTLYINIIVYILFILAIVISRFFSFAHAVHSTFTFIQLMCMRVACALHNNTCDLWTQQQAPQHQYRRFVKSYKPSSVGRSVFSYSGTFEYNRHKITVA